MARKKIGILALVVSLFFSNVVLAQSMSTASSTGTRSNLPPMGYCGVGVMPVVTEQAYDVNWNASVSNVNAKPEDYAWVGTDGFTANNNQTTYRYSNPGVKTGQVTIHSDQGDYSFNCSVIFPNIPPPNNQSRLGATCQPNVTGMQVLWVSTVSGVPDPNNASVEWFGSDGLATTTNRVNYKYSTAGLKTANLTVRAGGEVLYMTCQALVASTSNCFIATAAYGTPQEPEVMVLRHFRDETLLKSKAGQIFVDTYYKVSPPIADYIRDKEDPRAIVRAGLAPTIYILKKSGYE